jgi:hypothetical protein
VERRGAGDDSQGSEGGQPRDDILGDSLREVVLLGVAAHVLERQHRYPGRPPGLCIGWVFRRNGSGRSDVAVGCRQREDVFRSRHAFEVALPEITKDEPRWNPVPYHLLRRRRDQDLSPASEAHDTSRAVDGRPEVVAVSDLCLSGVHPDASLDGRRCLPGAIGKGSLNSHCRTDRIESRGEDCEGSVARLLQEDPAVGGDGVPGYLVVSRHGTLHGLVMLFPQTRAVHDVGEEKRDGARRVFAHSGSSRSEDTHVGRTGSERTNRMQFLVGADW